MLQLDLVGPGGDGVRGLKDETLEHIVDKELRDRRARAAGQRVEPELHGSLRSFSSPLSSMGSRSSRRISLYFPRISTAKVPTPSSLCRRLRMDLSSTHTAPRAAMIAAVNTPRIERRSVRESIRTSPSSAPPQRGRYCPLWASP